MNFPEAQKMTFLPSFWRANYWRCRRIYFSFCDCESTLLYMIWILAKMKVEYIFFLLFLFCNTYQRIDHNIILYRNVKKKYFFFLFLLIAVWGVAKDNHMIRKSCLIFSEGKSWGIAPEKYHSAISVDSKYWSFELFTKLSAWKYAGAGWNFVCLTRF